MPNASPSGPSDERSSGAVSAAAAREVAARETFAWIASHALRNVTHSIASSLEMLDAEEQGETLSARQRRLVQLASSSAARLLQVSADLQTLTHAAGQTLQSHCEPITLTTLLRETSAQAQAPLSPRSPRTIDSHVSPGAALALGDPTLARRALAALIENALRFSPPDTPITVEARKRVGRAHIRVLDAGGGVAPADADRIFEPLVVVARPENQIGVGLGIGLGLAVARACAEAQGGHVWLERAGKVGATFVLDLPLAVAFDVARPD
jgi:signal transduction histidine kinase